MAGILDTQAPTLFAEYAFSIRFREKVIGGTPMNARAIEAWIRTKMFTDKGKRDELEIRMLTWQTMQELGIEVDGEIDINNPEDWKRVIEASEKVAAEKGTVGFKVDDVGVYIESRHVKAMTKECVSILFPGVKWAKRAGYNGKAARGVTAEQVFVSPSRLYLFVDYDMELGPHNVPIVRGGHPARKPTGKELFVGHVTGPNGPQSSLTYYQYVDAPVIHGIVRVCQDVVPHDAWPSLWVLAQENALGALRSQDYGKFDLIRWDLVQPSKVSLGAKPVPPEEESIAPLEAALVA